MNVRADWLEWRRSGMGGSDVPRVLGVSPWGGPWDVWRSKVGSPLPDSESPAATRGHRLERAVVEWAVMELGADVSDVEWSPVAERDGWMLGSADALLRPIGSPPIGIEAKTHRTADFASDLAEEYQVRWYQAIFGIQTWYLATLILFTDEWILRRVDRDMAIEADMIARCRAWWDRHVVGGEPPPSDGSESQRRWLLAEHPEATSDRRQATAYEDACMIELALVRRAEEMAGSRRRTIEAEIKRSMGGVRRVVGDAGSATWSRFPRTHFDTSRLKQDHPALCATYTRTETADRFVYTPPKNNGQN